MANRLIPLDEVVKDILQTMEKAARDHNVPVGELFADFAEWISVCNGFPPKEH